MLWLRLQSGLQSMELLLEAGRPACRWFLPWPSTEGLNSSPGGPHHNAPGASSRRGSWLSPEQEVWGRARKSPYAFYNPVSEVTPCYFLHIPLEGSHWVQLTFTGKEINFHLFKGRDLKNLWIYFQKHFRSHGWFLPEVSGNEMKRNLTMWAIEQEEGNPALSRNLTLKKKRCNLIIRGGRFFKPPVVSIC